jgi:hypothetical protein
MMAVSDRTTQSRTHERVMNDVMTYKQEDGGHKRERQVITGTKINTIRHMPVFIFASLWPSWLTAAEALSFREFMVHVEDASQATKRMLQRSTDENHRIVDKDQWKSGIQEFLNEEDSRVGLVLIQGAESTVIKVCRWLASYSLKKELKDKVCVVAGFTDGQPSRKKFEGCFHERVSKRQRVRSNMETDKTFFISHTLVGGVIDHQWSFLSNVDITSEMLQGVSHQSEVQAKLGDYLSPTEKGSETAVPGKTQDTIPWKKRKLQVVSPNVFSSTRWVRRHLTHKELMDIYDVNASLKPKKGDEEGATTDFTQQIPARVLIRCLEVIFMDLSQKANDGEQCDHQMVNTPKDSGMTSDIQQEITQLEAIARRHVTDESRDAEAGNLVDDSLSNKNDDAEIKVDEWNVRAVESVNIRYDSELHGVALNVLRKGLFRRYCHHRYGVIGSFKRFMQQEYGTSWLDEMRAERKGGRGCEADIVKSYTVGVDAIRRALESSFWDWSAGSTIFFWRWPRELWRELRDGSPVWFRRRDLPRFWKGQRWPKEADERDKLHSKVSKVIERGYITHGHVKSLTSFFAVPKGEGDIRVVYDASRSGLNDAIWTPNFCLPTMDTVLANADASTYFGDIDLGEMFLNYFLDASLRPYAGVDVSGFSNTEKKQGRELMRWERALMGVKSSPFNCVRIYLFGEDVIKGDRKRKTNPFRWDRVVDNLPGTANYDPSKPWIYKYDEVNGCMANFVVSYVDDLRTGSQRGKEECDRTTHTMASGLNYLGEQDAARKRKMASQNPGPWAGAVMESVKGEGLYVSTSLAKWTKTRTILQQYRDIIKAAAEKKEVKVWLNKKRLEQDTGFLVHMFMAYKNMRPYLKGFYLTLNGWRFDRDDGGWQLGKRHWKDIAEDIWGDEARWEEAREQGKRGEEGDSELVAMVPQMERDVEFLSTMFGNAQPAKRLVRGVKIARIIYGFGDASGAGFGSSWMDGSQLTRRNMEDETRSRVKYRFGRWGSEGDGTSSNYRELRNLVDSLVEMSRQGDLTGVEVFLFTDNSTAEAAFNRGSSSSPLLFELVKKVKLLEMCHRARVHVIHIAGTRMIDQGTDGLSRGCLVEGVMRGDSIASFIPLHQTALERSEAVLKWLREAHGGGAAGELTVLGKEDWYVRGHDIVGSTTNVDGRWLPEYGVGQYVWAPPPCVAAQCLEEIRKARHKRQVSTHVFVCPRIMTVDWQRHLYKSADLVVVLNPGHTAWEENQHEPLILGFYFPYLRHEPWQLKGSDKIVAMGGQLQRMCKDNPSASGCFLRQLWNFTRKLSGMPEQLVCQMLHRSTSHQLPQATTRKRRRAGVEEEKG